MKLQEYKGYFVDYRLRQFRSNVPFPERIEFVSFDSDEGDVLLVEMLERGLVPIEKLSAINN